MFQISSLNTVAFSGSRHGCPRMPLEQAIAKVSPEARVLVGCARGVDEVVRQAFPRAEVFRFIDHPGLTVPAKLANRTAAMIEALASAGNGGLIAFPMQPCPNAVVPVRQWHSARGSGTWGAIALAVGLGIPTVVWLPSEFEFPDWPSHGIDRVSSSWYLCLPF